MNKEYDLTKDKDLMLSEHISLWEMRSHCNGVLTTNKVICNTKLPESIEKLMKVLGANVCLISSGYRDAKCDKLVGGSGRGQHCEGNAVDICFKANGKVISPKIVSCKAQDLGFGGIARINNNYTHLDVREGKRYLGDETKGTNSVTTDFYKYYGIDKVNKDIEKVCKKFSLDNDFWQVNYCTDLGKECIIDLFEKISKKI